MSSKKVAQGDIIHIKGHDGKKILSLVILGEIFTLDSSEAKYAVADLKGNLLDPLTQEDIDSRWVVVKSGWKEAIIFLIIFIITGGLISWLLWRIIWGI